MEGLNIALKMTCKKGIFTGVKLPHEEISICHLFYADDALFVGEWSRENIRNLVRILRCFSVSSGLKVNFHNMGYLALGWICKRL